MSYHKKDKLAEKASEFQGYIQDNLYKEVSFSIKNTIIYSKSLNLESAFTADINIEVIDLDTASAVAKNEGAGKLCVLNFASFKKPGGGYLNGAMAQDVAICGESILYPVLCAFEERFYEYNRKNMRNGMYMNRALYSKDILFTSNVMADVITCAAPNLSSAIKFDNKKVIDSNKNELKSRIKFILDIALENKVDTLILGAFGCGVFKQNAKEVAEIFKALLQSEGKMLNFKKVVFAVPIFNAKSKENYHDFVSCFQL